MLASICNAFFREKFIANSETGESLVRVPTYPMALARPNLIWFNVEFGYLIVCRSLNLTNSLTPVIIIIVMLNCSLQAVLLVVATVALAAPQHTGAHSAWPLPYAG